jgi:hypothetical protein
MLVVGTGGHGGNIPFCWFWMFSFDVASERGRGESRSRSEKGWRMGMVRAISESQCQQTRRRVCFGGGTSPSSGARQVNNTRVGRLGRDMAQIRADRAIEVDIDLDIQNCNKGVQGREGIRAGIPGYMGMPPHRHRQAGRQNARQRVSCSRNSGPRLAGLQCGGVVRAIQLLAGRVEEKEGCTGRLWMDSGCAERVEARGIVLLHSTPVYCSYI